VFGARVIGERALDVVHESGSSASVSAR
jgi:hypothetical protein